MKPITYIRRHSGKVITEHPPGEAFLKFLYHHPFGRLSLEALVKRKFLSALYGRWMSRPASRQQIQPFVDQFGIDMREAVEPVSAFRSFNAFFYRKLRAEARPLGEGLVSPADGKLIAFEDLSEVSDFFVKGQPFTLTSFLQNEALAAEYERATLLVVRLAPHDYHRFHFPASGLAAAAQAISGAYYSVSPLAVREDFGRIFCENKREYTVLDTDAYGRVIISPVGATMVGSIIETYAPGSQVQKGDEMGYFAFGGSSILMLIHQDRITIDADLLAHTRRGLETSILMGERIGQ
jgi:phosphatidylserine decarboxylase